VLESFPQHGHSKGASLQEPEPESVLTNSAQQPNENNNDEQVNLQNDIVITDDERSEASNNHKVQN